jgi:putative holliday junction resolvase
VLQPHRCQPETYGAESLLLRAGIRIAVDVGSARIGLAHCDPDGLMASPLTTVKRGSGDVQRIADLAVTDTAMEIIVGLPTTLAGREGSAAEDARSFAAAVAARLAPVPVRLVDERFTTVIAHDVLRQGGKNSKRRRTVVDRTAAALLLQGALDTERATGRPPGELVRPQPGGLT